MYSYVLYNTIEKSGFNAVSAYLLFIRVLSLLKSASLDIQTWRIYALLWFALMR